MLHKYQIKTKQIKQHVCEVNKAWPITHTHTHILQLLSIKIIAIKQIKIGKVWKQF